VSFGWGRVGGGQGRGGGRAFFNSIAISPLFVSDLSMRLFQPFIISMEVERTFSKVCHSTIPYTSETCCKPTNSAISASLY